MMRPTVNYSEHVDAARDAFIDKLMARIKGIPYEEPPLPVLAVEQSSHTDVLPSEPVPEPERPCACGCGLPLLPGAHALARYRERECRLRGAKIVRLKTAKKREYANCVICGISFEVGHKKKTCSSVCLLENASRMNLLLKQKWAAERKAAANG